MARKLTREIRYVKLPEKRIREIDELVDSWPHETKSFMRVRLNQYRPPSGIINTLIETFLSFFMSAQEKNFEILKDPDVLTDFKMRFEISGQTDPQEAWNKILEKEVSAKEYKYLLALLDKHLKDVHVPDEMADLFEKVYRAHIRKEYLSDPSIPKAPLLLITGPSGSGKSATVNHSVERIIFAGETLAEVDLKQKKEELLSTEPFWKSLEEIDPTLAMETIRRDQLRWYKRLARIPLIRSIFKRRIGRNLSDLEEQGVFVDYEQVTPNDYQTALAGEPGNYFKKALGDPRKTTIRHIEEAHSAFGKAEGRGESSGVERQQRTLVDTANIVIDEIINGRRDCLLIATTDQPERFDNAIYRRFVEKGRIIDISEYWKNPANVREVVCLELARNDIRVGEPVPGSPAAAFRYISHVELDRAVSRLFVIFKERNLVVTPAYLRKLVHSVIEITGGFKADALEDPILVRQAFEIVAKNVYGDLFPKVVDRMDRDVRWEDYVGGIKDLFSEMANNCLHYGVSEEKGVVANGPPGSGKTFLVRTWLSENKDIHDLSASPNLLYDPVNPIDGAVDNLEKIYEIAKMIAPSVVFFDEGDAIAPKRSATGGSPSDKLTNKFLSLIDGEVPLNRVFTVLTTNRIDILDPALIRSKRLKVLGVAGHLSKDNIAEIVAQGLEGIPLGDGMTMAAVVDSARGICNTPADYTAFVEKARSLRNTEFEVLLRMRTMETMPEAGRLNFVKFNFKTLLGILEAANCPSELRAAVRRPEAFLEHYEEVMHLLEPILSPEQYPLGKSHLTSARQEISQSPVKKGKVELDEFLEHELSQEPQVGFVIGVGANDTTGVLLPIATSLTYSLAADKVLVTGAVSSPAAGAAEMDMAVQMTQQSAQEALTMVKNYLQSLESRVSMPRLLGEFLEKYTIHHQLLSATYNVGGPSAGYALAINTLSAMLHIPVYNDFGITGAPWTKGVKKGEVGGSVIIGGHKKKTEKVLAHLRRMYMPLQNYKDLETEFLVNYWTQDKDILGVTNFGDLIPEVVWLGPAYEADLLDLIRLRIEYKLEKYNKEREAGEIKDTILEKKNRMRAEVEKEIITRLRAIRKYLRSPGRDPHLSLEEIFKRRRITAGRLINPVLRYFKRQTGRSHFSEVEAPPDGQD